jgi:hypothetical protein
MMTPMPRKPLAPLIPLDDLKKVVAGLIAVPKDAISRPGTQKAKPRKKATKAT